jgi:hypothetical protein
MAISRKIVPCMVIAAPHGRREMVDDNKTPTREKAAQWLARPLTFITEFGVLAIAPSI